MCISPRNDRGVHPIEMPTLGPVAEPAPPRLAAFYRAVHLPEGLGRVHAGLQHPVVLSDQLVARIPADLTIAATKIIAPARLPSSKMAQSFKMSVARTRVSDWSPVRTLIDFVLSSPCVFQTQDRLRMVPMRRLRFLVGAGIYNIIGLSFCGSGRAGLAQYCR